MGVFACMSLLLGDLTASTVKEPMSDASAVTLTRSAYQDDLWFSDGVAQIFDAASYLRGIAMAQVSHISVETTFAHLQSTLAVIWR